MAPGWRDLLASILENYFIKKKRPVKKKSKRKEVRKREASRRKQKY
jgi:hypothetical protein